MIALFCAFATSATAQDPFLPETPAAQQQNGGFLGFNTDDSTEAYRDLDSITAVEEKPGKLQFTERPDDQLLIVALVVDDQLLNEGFLVYLDEDDILIPLGVLSEMLGFPIEVTPATGRAQGWFVREENTFSLKYPFGSITIGGQEIVLEGQDKVELHEDDIYVNKRLLEKWFPINLIFKFNELALYLSTKEALPFQEEAARREKWERARMVSAPPTLKLDDSVIRLPHRKFAPPNISVNHNLSAAKTGGVSTHNSNHSLQLQGDFLYMDMRSGIGLTTASDGDNQLQNAEFTLSKTDLDGNLLGPLKATEIEIGDTTAYNFPLAGGSQRGRGVTLSNRPANFVRDPDRYLLEGFGEVGWDLEVYQDERLVDFFTIGSDGRYSFQALPLRQGFNLFRLVFYGPNGQKREKFERVYLGANMVEPGKLVYEVSALESSSPLFDPSKNPQPDTDPTFSVIGEYGIRKNLSANLGFFTGPFAADDMQGVGGGIRMSGASMFAQGNFFQSLDGGHSASVTLTGNLSKQIIWNAGHTEHRGYAMNQREILRESFLGFSHNFSLPALSSGSYGFDVRRQLRENGTTETVLTNRLSAGFLGFSLTNEIEYNIVSSNAQDNVLGTLTIRRRLPIGNFRGRLNYNLSDAQTLDSIEIQFQNQLSDKMFLNTILNSTFGDTPLNTLSSTLDMTFKKYRLGVTASLNDDGDVRTGVNVAYNLVPQSLKGDYKMSGDAADLSSGNLMIQPFLDTNGNGIRDEGEELVPDVVFRNAQRGIEMAAGPDGMLSMKGISPNAINRILLKEDSLPDIYMRAPKKELRVLGKQGISGPIDFPLVKTGEISGTVTAYNHIDQEETAVENLLIVLKNKQGEEVARVYTEYDGFYVFPSLPIGEYEMFFPKNTTRDKWYVGEGTGPSFKLTSEEPDWFDGDVFIAPHRIDFYQSFPESERIMERSSAAERPAGEKLGFIGLNTEERMP
jgi:hypothetical protein